MADTPETQEEQLELGGEGSEETPAEGSSEKSKSDDAALEELRAELQRLAEANAELRGRLSAQPAQAPKAEPVQPRDLTRGELQQMVDRGDISEVEMEQRLEQQHERKLRAIAREEAEAREAQRRADSLFQQYSDAIPGLREEGSENRRRVQAEYQKLVRSGLPDGPQTELTALAMAFGPPEKIQERKPKRETHQETGSSSGSPEQKPGPQWQKGLKQHHIEYAKKMLEDGYYSGPDDARFKRYCENARNAKNRTIAVGA